VSEYTGLNMRVLVTRPRKEAVGWVNDLIRSGFDAVAIPLLEIAAVEDTGALQHAWHHLDDYAGVMFVSGNAVDFFFASKPDSALCNHGFSAIKTRAWGPGPGTASALLRAGLAPECMDSPAADSGQFDSESLWQMVGQQVKPGARVLIVRGGQLNGLSSGVDSGVGRDWFATQVIQAGGKVDYVVAYRRGAPALSAVMRSMAADSTRPPAVWLFSSSEAVGNLRVSLPGLDWSCARAVVTHPRIAQAARAAGFGVVCESRPALSDIMASIKSLA
jgi:uroporphyrinogen-III synthase